MADEGLDDCTQYEGKDGFALVDKAQHEALRAEVERLREQNARLTGSDHKGRVPIKVELMFLSWDHREESNFDFEECSAGELHGGTCFNGKIELYPEDIDRMREAESNGGTACFLVNLNDSVASVRRLRDEWE
jgi:hypothetical protein